MARVDYLNIDGLKRLVELINRRMNDIVAGGIHQCRSCGAPYSGQPICEYCGRGFFVDLKMYQDNYRGNN